MAHEDRFSRAEIVESDSPEAPASAVRKEPAPQRRKGFSISLFWNVGFEFNRPKRQSRACPEPANEADLKPGARKQLLEA
jgi:hypothetical protein